MEWTEGMSFGVAALDGRRKDLLAMGGGLVLAVREQVCRYAIRHVIASLEDHGSIYFREEERYMLFYQYPGYPGHRAEHDKFIADVFMLKGRLLNPDPGAECSSYELSVEAVRMVADWGRGHMAGADKRLGDFLKAARRGSARPEEAAVSV